MNATGLGLAAVLLVVLFAVVLGAQQLQDQQSNEIARLMQDRDHALVLAQDAAGQRDAAVAQLKPALDRVAALETQATQKDQQIAALSNDLATARKDIAALQTSYEQAVAQINEGAAIPVTGQSDTICVPELTRRDPFPWTAAGAGLLAGMAVLGGGRYLIYRIEANHRVTVRMTREQLKEYARYQRSLKQ